MLPNTETRPNNNHYEVIIGEDTVNKMNAYLAALKTGKQKPGSRLADLIKKNKVKLDKISPAEFLELIVQTKMPVVYAESELANHLKENKWNNAEYSILAGVNFRVPAIAYDNGARSKSEITVHETPLAVDVLFTNGPLLAFPTSPDFQEIIKNNKVDSDAYLKIFEARLLPLLVAESIRAGQDGALITLPGLGAGFFAGPFVKGMNDEFQKMLINLLEKHHAKLPNIKGVIFDPYIGDAKEPFMIGHMQFQTRPYKLVEKGAKSYLNPAASYDPKFAKCKTVTIVAGDPVSYACNEGQKNSRESNEAAIASGTNAMEVLAEKPGKYDAGTNTFRPKDQHASYLELNNNQGTQLKTNHRTLIVGNDGKTKLLSVSPEAAVLNDLVIKGNSSVMQKLNPGNINAVINIHGGTALSTAVHHGRVDLVSILLTVPGMDVNRQDLSGNTPLARAFFAQPPNPDIVKSLLEKGADILLRNASKDDLKDLSQKFAEARVFDAATRQKWSEVNQLIHVIASKQQAKKPLPEQPIVKKPKIEEKVEAGKELPSRYQGTMFAAHRRTPSPKNIEEPVPERGSLVKK